MASSMDGFRNQLTKRYGGRLTQTIQPYEVISTGSMALDVVTRIGGYVRGRTHEIIGPPAAAKTSMSILGAVEHQRATDKAVGWIDMEHSFDFDWAQSLGLDVSPERFTHIFPDDSEDVADMIKAMTQSGLYSEVVVDSIGGMESKKAFDKDAGEVTMGRNAQVITRMVKQVSALAWNNQVTVIFVNQHRANLSGLGMTDIPAGPRALQYNTTMSLKAARASGTAAETTLTVKELGQDKPIPVGYKFMIKVQRSRVASQGRQTDLWLINESTDQYGPIGIDRAEEAASVGIMMEIITRAGSNYTLPTGGTFFGRPKLVTALRAEPAAIAEIRRLALDSVSHEVTEKGAVSMEEDDSE